MRYHQLLVLLSFGFCLSFFDVSAQSKLIGVVMDGVDDNKLEKATVVLLNPSDSILKVFAWTKEGGKFAIPAVDTGRYKLVVSYPEYADLVQDIHVQTTEHDLGALKLSKSALLIDEVLIHRRAPVTIKGDTIEYDAASFKVDKDAKVDQLLKVLPGITVGPDGKITAQGKEVKKVLLDGEEFFGNDPTLITKNIRSDMVDKVQVYEKRSELADRTGVDDGERIQTIDIKLKEDKKQGMFGDAVAGVGTNQYYAGKVMLNRFKGSQKIAVFGVGANDGLVGLDFEEGQKYGMDGGQMTITEDGGIMINSSGQDGISWDGSFNGNGIPRAINTGISFSDKTSDNKHKVNISYRRSMLDVKNNSENISQNNLPEIALIDRSKGFTDRESRSNNANLRYDLKVDSMSDLMVRIGYRNNNQDNAARSESAQQNLDLSAITETTMRSTDVSTSRSLNADILLTRRFKKERRSLTLNAVISSDDSNSDNQFFSQTNRVSDGHIATVDQLKNNENNNTNFGTSLNYTEPLSKTWTATLGYAMRGQNSATLNESFNKNVLTGVYDQLDQSVLNDFDFKTISNGLTTGLNWKKEKFTFNLTNQVYYEDVRRDYNNISTVLKRDQISFMPSASFNYNMSKNKSASFYYSGRSMQPSLTQIEPLKQNAQQTISYLDNFDLNTGFSHSYNLDYNHYRPLRDVSFYAGLWASQQDNSISSKMDYNKATGITNIQYVNVDRSNWNMSLYGSYRFPINKKRALTMNLGGSVGYSNFYNYLALNAEPAVLNNSISYTISPRVGVSSYRADKWSFWGSMSPGLRKESSSVQPNLNNTSFVMRSSFEISYTFPKDIRIGVNINQNYQDATKTLEAFSQVNMNGYVSKKFLKDKSLEGQIFVNDILNQNNGIYRYQNGNVFSQTSNDVLRRYGMFKLIYHFTTMKGGAE